MIAMQPRRIRQMRRLNDVAVALHGLRSAHLKHSWRERLERCVTDAPIQSLRYRFAAWRLNRAPDGSKDEETQKDRFADAESTFVFGRPLTAAGYKTYQWLCSQGLNRRELRLAVCCRFITRDGEIRINWLKERILQLLSVSFALLVLICWIDLLVQLGTSPSTLFVKITFAGVMLMIFVVAAYPIVLLGATPLQIAQRIRDIQKNNGSADLTNRCD